MRAEVQLSVYLNAFNLVPIAKPWFRSDPHLSYHFLGMFLSHSPWVRWTGKGLEFTGKVGHTSSLDEWAAGPGAPTIADVASTLSAFGLGARESRAKDKIADSLTELFKSSEPLATAVDNFAASYPTRFAALVDERWEELPHSGSVDLRFVPVFYVNEQEKRKWTDRFAGSVELQSVAGGLAVVDFFLSEIAVQSTAAFTEAAPESPAKDRPIDKPFQTGEKWVVGFDPQYLWVPLSSIDQPGHFYTYSSLGTRSSAKGKDAKEARLEAANTLVDTKDWLGTISAEDRAAIANRLAVG